MCQTPKTQPAPGCQGENDCNSCLYAEPNFPHFIDIMGSYQLESSNAKMNVSHEKQNSEINGG